MLYPYKCSECGNKQDITMSLEEYNKGINVICKKCGAVMNRVWSAKDGNKPLSIKTKGVGFAKQGFTL